MMMKRWSKVLSAILAAAMLLTICAGAGADNEATLSGGKTGGFAEPDTPVSQNKAIKIAKELTAYNVDETTIKAPTISYTYTIAAGSADISITDAAGDHQSGEAVNRQTIAGETTGLKVNGTAGTSGVIAWTTEDNLTADKAGAANYKYLTIDFSGVVFGAPGIYRYEITEALTDGYSYSSSGVTQTTDATHGHTRYLDVYVKPADGYTDGTTAADWDIYGYVCTCEEEEITAAGDTATTGACKTNGFVAATNDSTEIKADSYYTFNVTVSKTLTGDNYSGSHPFPVHVDFTNAEVTKNVLLMAETSGTVTDYAHTAAAASSLDGLAKIAHGGSIKYIGIPCGTTVDVYETNDVAGTTYTATLTVDGTAGTTKSISSTATPTAFAAYAEQVYNSNKGTVTTTADTVDNTDGHHTIAIANVLQLISPTGVVLRYAPYLLMLAAGAVLFVIFAVRRRKHTEDDD